jgi:uncharacterized protein (TIGR02246 family)
MDAQPETRAIEALVAEAQAKQLDLEPFLALHTDDLTVVNFGGRRVVGKDALRGAMSAALGSQLAQVMTTTELHDIRFVRPDVAIVSATKHVDDQRDTDDSFASKGAMTYVVVKDPEAGWRITLAQTTPIAGS